MRHFMRSRIVRAASVGLLLAPMGGAAPPGMRTGTVRVSDPAPVAPVNPMPADAREILDQFDREQAKAAQDMEDKISPKRIELIQQLQAMQDKYTRAAKLDEAVAIRDRIRQLVQQTGGSVDSPLENPGNLTAYRDRVGRRFFFKVTADSQGTIWGSDVYTDDSPLSAVAVHTGILKPGQQSVVRVLILPGRESYDDSSRNGITSQPFGTFQGSYIMELAPGAKVTDVPAERANPGRLP